MLTPYSNLARLSVEDNRVTEAGYRGYLRWCWVVPTGTKMMLTRLGMLKRGAHLDESLEEWTRLQCWRRKGDARDSVDGRFTLFRIVGVISELHLRWTWCRNGVRLWWWLSTNLPHFLSTYVQLEPEKILSFQIQFHIDMTPERFVG